MNVCLFDQTVCFSRAAPVKMKLDTSKICRPAWKCGFKIFGEAGPED